MPESPATTSIGIKRLVAIIEVLCSVFLPPSRLHWKPCHCRHSHCCNVRTTLPSYTNATPLLLRAMITFSRSNPMGFFSNPLHEANPNQTPHGFSHPKPFVVDSHHQNMPPWPFFTFKPLPFQFKFCFECGLLTLMFEMKIFCTFYMHFIRLICYQINRT